MNLDLTKPDGLSEAGSLACDVITRFLTSKDMGYAGLPEGSHGIFYSPEEWAGRDELYGWDGVLVITHDGGNHAGAFNWAYEQYALMEELRAELNKIDCYAEQCTCWYSAVYHKPKRTYDQS